MKKIILNFLLLFTPLFCFAGSGSFSHSPSDFYLPITFHSQTTQYVDLAGTSDPTYLNDIRFRLISNAQSEDFRIFNLNLHTTDAASSTGAGGNGLRLLHAGAVHDSTDTVQDMNVAQLNCIGGVQGSSVNLGNLSKCEILRMLAGFSTSGTANFDETNVIHILSPNMTSAGVRTMPLLHGILIDDLEQSGVTDAWSIKTGTGKVEFGDEVTLNEISNTPASPSTSDQINMYIRNDNLVIQYDDAGTVRYYYLDLTSAAGTWTHSTTAP